MMKRLQKLIHTFAFAAMLAAPVLTLAIPQTALAASDADSCSKRILGMPTWFRGVVKVEDGQCVITPPASGGDVGLGNFIWKIALNVIEIGLFIAGYTALFFVMYGGFQFLTRGDNPGQVEKARITILNAVIGLVISIASIAIVNLIFGVING